VLARSLRSAQAVRRARWHGNGGSRRSQICRQKYLRPKCREQFVGRDDNALRLYNLLWTGHPRPSGRVLSLFDVLLGGATKALRTIEHITGTADPRQKETLQFPNFFSGLLNSIQAIPSTYRWQQNGYRRLAALVVRLRRQTAPLGIQSESARLLVSLLRAVAFVRDRMRPSCSFP